MQGCCRAASIHREPCVFSEEVISKDNTIWFSEDGNMMAYASFNDTKVDIMPLQLYGEAGKLEYQYPITIPLRYPKVSNGLQW